MYDGFAAGDMPRSAGPLRAGGSARDRRLGGGKGNTLSWLFQRAQSLDGRTYT